LATAAAIVGWISWGSTASADWASCRSKPTRTCLLDEALGGDHGQFVGKERLDVLALTSYRSHPEYLTTADIDEAKLQLMSKPAPQPALRWQYFTLAATGLIATDRVQEALDLIPVLDDGWRNNALNEVIRALIKADRLDDIPLFGRPMLADPRYVYSTAAKVLAEQGKIEQALAFAALNPAGEPSADMLQALGVAYARRGDHKMAARFYDKVQSYVTQRAPSVVQDHTAIELRFDQILLQAARGDADGTRAALKELPAVSDKPSNWVEINRNAGYQKLIVLLLQLDNPGVAIDVARSSPERYRPYDILLVALWDAEHGRLDESREIMSSLGDATDPKVREALLRGIAIATAKSGDVTAAVAMAEQVSDPVRHRAIMFELAQSLPP
jgi:tetratricopeptide (TPR) repeat protein